MKDKAELEKELDKAFKNGNIDRINAASTAMQVFLKKEQKKKPENPMGKRW